MISKKNRNKDANMPASPEEAKPRGKKDRVSGKETGSEGNVTLSRGEFDELNSRIASADAQVELYQFQVRNLRKDLEQIKLHSVLSNLGGPVVISEREEVRVVAEEQQEPQFPSPVAETAPEEFDETPFIAALEPGPASVDLDALLDWYLATPEPPEAHEPVRHCVFAEEPRSVKPVLLGEEAEVAEEQKDDAADGAQTDRREDYSISGMRQNLIACMDTITMLLRKVARERERVGNRDTLIQLLKDKSEIAEQNVSAEYVPAAAHALLLQKFEELKNECRVLELEIGERGAHEENLNNAAARIEKLEEEIKSQKELYNALANEKEAMARERDEMAAGLDKQMEEFRGKMKSLAGDQLRAGMEIVEQLEKENAALTKESGALKEEIARITREFGEHNIELQGRIDSITEEKERIMEQRLPALERLNEELSGDIVSLKRELEALKTAGEMDISRLSARIRQLEEEKVIAANAAEERMELEARRAQDERDELLAAAAARDEENKRLVKDMREIRAENALQKKTNFELMSRMELARHKTRETADKNFPDIKRKLLDKFAADSSPASLLELRRLFLNTRKYDEAVRTFRQLLIEPGNQKYMPTVCLLVGEFYNLSGRTEEASFYLANPLIKDDPFAQRLLNTINIENATTSGKGDETKV